MTTTTEALKEVLAFRRALEKLVMRFPRAKHLSSTEILGGQTALLVTTMGSFAAQHAIAHILDHNGYSCASSILEGIGDAVEYETRTCFERIAKIHDLDLDSNKPAATMRARASRIIRIGDMITDADLLEAMDEEEHASDATSEEELDVNTETRNDILRMIKTEEQS